MSRIGTMVTYGTLSLALGLLGACDDGGRSGTDAGGGIRLPDSGGSGGGTDAGGGGGGGTDAGGGGGGAMCTVASIPQLESSEALLPAACLPRCSATTATTIFGTDAMGTGGCFDDMQDPPPSETCVQSALMADTYPTATVSDGSAMAELNCLAAYYTQLLGCVNQACPTEFAASNACYDAGGNDTTCADQNAAVNTCIGEGGAGAATFDTCAQTNLPPVFDLGGAFLPEARAFNLSPTALAYFRAMRPDLF